MCIVQPCVAVVSPLVRGLGHRSFASVLLVCSMHCGYFACSLLSVRSADRTHRRHGRHHGWRTARSAARLVGHRVLLRGKSATRRIVVEHSLSTPGAQAPGNHRRVPPQLGVCDSCTGRQQRQHDIRLTVLPLPPPTPPPTPPLPPPPTNTTTTTTLSTSTTSTSTTSTTTCAFRRTKQLRGGRWTSWGCRDQAPQY